ncbi:unnamed protein product [Alternaria alternata]
MWSSFLSRARPTPERTPAPAVQCTVDTSEDIAVSVEDRHIDISELQPTIVLDDSGDATLLVGTDSAALQPVQVSSTAMTLASPVWKDMFERHRKANGAIEVPLRDDEIDALYIALRIAHLRFHEIPRKDGLTIDALLELAVVCARYDIVKLVRPFLDLYGWAQCHYPDTDAGERCDPAWFYVAWTFGYKDSFQRLTRFIVKKIGLDEDGNAIMDDGQKLPKYMPPGLLARMMEIRETTISAMLDILYDILDDIIHVFVCQVDESWEPKCRATVLGSFISFLLENDLYPARRTASETPFSIQKLYDLASSAQILTLESHDYREMAMCVRRSSWDPASVTADTFKNHGGLTLHKKCFGAFHLRSKLKTIYSDIGSAVLQSHIEHMDRQALK